MARCNWVTVPNDTVNYRGHNIEHRYHACEGQLPDRWAWFALGQMFNSIGQAEMFIDKYMEDQAKDAASQGPDVEPPTPPEGQGGGSGGGAGGGGGGGWDASRSGPMEGYVPGETPGTGWDVPTGSSTASTTATPAVPGWMQERMNFWDEKQKQLLEAARAAYQYSGKKYEEAWQQVGEQAKEGAKELQKKYGQALGIVAQGESQQQSALARYAATGRMSGGAAEQAMTSAAREAAKGAMGAYGSYASGRAALADTTMRTYAALGAEASKYTQMVVDAMRAMPNPYTDWANFMNGLANFSGVAVS